MHLCTTTTSVVRTRYYVWYSGTYVCMSCTCMSCVHDMCSTRVVHGTVQVVPCVHTHVVHNYSIILLVLEVLEWYNNISF